MKIRVVMKKVIIGFLALTSISFAFAGNTPNKIAKEYCSNEYKNIQENRVNIERHFEDGIISQEERTTRLEIQRLSLKNVYSTCVELLGSKTNLAVIAEEAAKEIDLQLKPEMEQLIQVDSEMTDLIINH